MIFLSWLVLGLIAGYVGSTILNKGGSGRMLDVALGAVGAVVCGYIGTLVGIGAVFGLNLSTLFSLVVAIIGAVVVQTVYHSVAGRS
ncbi:MAG: GlsB/YeaQ/YmgE family stress response membrane protein [Roseiarcus sp.]